MRIYQVIALAASSNLLLLPASGQVADLSKQDPIEMVVELGMVGGDPISARPPIARAV